MTMRIELLAFDGCPNVRETIDVLQQALRLEGIDAPIQLVDVDSSEAAQHLRFLGSPSVRIDGEDVEPMATERTTYGMMCRTYNSGTGNAGVPPIDILRAAVRAAIPQR
jgi:hypothetical protein